MVFGVFDSIKQIWNDRGFEILLAICVIFILLYAIYRKITGGKGTWNGKSHYRYLLSEESAVKRGGGGGGGGDYPISVRSKNGGESKGEIECRRVLEYLFKKPFPKARPDFLRNPVTGGNFNLELDCYNAELGIAVEYNGEQHYRYIPYFHRNKESFYNQKYRDDMKRRLCKDAGVFLIEVPYTVKIEEIKGYIESHLQYRQNIINKQYP